MRPRGVCPSLFDFQICLPLLIIRCRKKKKHPSGAVGVYLPHLLQYNTSVLKSQPFFQKNRQIFYEKCHKNILKKFNKRAWQKEKGMLYYRHKREGKAVKIMKRVVETKFMRRAFEQRRRPLKISRWGAWVNREGRNVSPPQRRVYCMRFYISPSRGMKNTVGKTAQPRRRKGSRDRKYPKKGAMTIMS